MKEQINKIVRYATKSFAPNVEEHSGKEDEDLCYNLSQRQFEELHQLIPTLCANCCSEGRWGTVYHVPVHIL